MWRRPRNRLYIDGVLALSPLYYWPLEESSSAGGWHHVAIFTEPLP